MVGFVVKKLLSSFVMEDEAGAIESLCAVELAFSTKTNTTAKTIPATKRNAKNFRARHIHHFEGRFSSVTSDVDSMFSASERFGYAAKQGFKM